MRHLPVLLLPVALWAQPSPPASNTITTNNYVTIVNGYQPNQTLTGCGVEYTSGLSFTVGACRYTIAGTLYNSPLTTITLATADVTNPRIDVISVNASSVVAVTTGTPATPPQQPTVDPSTTLELTFVYVPANSSTPTGVTSTTIYDENTEWTCTATANLNCASTVNPYHLTKDIEATSAVLTNNVTLVKPAAGTVDTGNFQNLTFYIRSKGQWPTGNGAGNAARSVSIFWQNGSTQKGSAVVINDGAFGFKSSITNAYQQISIPTSLFGNAGTAVTTLVFQISGSTGTTSIGFYLDEVTLQTSLGTPTVSVAQTRRSCSFDNDTQSSTVLTAAQFSGHCVVPYAATIVEVDVSGGTQTLTGSATASTFTGTSSIQIGKKGVTNNTALLSGALATVSGVACALTLTSGNCLFNNGMASSGTITVTTTAIAPGDELYVSAATADGVQTWYTVAVIFTVN